MKVVLVTGGFDPLHSGHIEYFKAAKELGDLLVVGVNSDAWLTRKKGRPFMSGGERITIIQNLAMVDHCVLFDDDDNTAKEAIKNVRFMYPEAHIIFANGGDRTNTTTPEFKTYGDMPKIEFAFGVGGENKMNSSSWILDEWKTQKTERPWGYWRVLDDKKTVKVKELVIEPGKSLSDQKHTHRNEHWYVLQGEVTLAIETLTMKNTINLTETKNRSYVIPKGVWHLASNKTDSPAHILEVQYGTECVEEDIERR